MEQPTPNRTVTRESQALAALEREFAEVEAQQEERFRRIEAKRELLASWGLALDD